MLSVTRFSGTNSINELTRFSLATQVTAADRFSISVFFSLSQVTVYNSYRVLAIRFSIICYDIDNIESSKKYSVESILLADFNVLISAQSQSMRN